jgi:hypothetical protein
MKTTDFNKTMSSAKLQENIEKQFGSRVNLSKYDREQLEDFRNKIRTRIFQLENSAGINELLTNETYQKDKAMLELLNTRIKEMLGEQMKQLRDRMDQLTEAKKAKDQDGDGKKNFDDVQIARMVAGGVPKKKAIAKAKSDNFKEEMKSRTVKGKSYGADYDAGADDAPAPSKDKKFDSSELAKVMGGTAPKNPAKGRVHKMKEGAKHPADCDCHECMPMEGEKWVQKAVKGIKKGALRSQEGKKKGEKFSKSELKGLAKSGTPKEKKRAQFALNISKKNESIEAFKQNVRMVNEGLIRLLAEDEEGKAKTITAASDMVNDYTGWMQRVGQFQTKAMIELADSIRADFGAAQAEAFKQAVAPALSATLETLTQQRETISNAVASLAGEQMPENPMGAEPNMGTEPGMEPTEPDMMNEPSGDDFAASDAAAGGSETAGREMRESSEQRRARKLAESHSIIAKLAQ